VNEQQLWIRGYALRPRQMSDGDWIWLRPYEWRWTRAVGPAPLAVQRPAVEARRLADQRHK